MNVNKHASTTMGTRDWSFCFICQSTKRNEPTKNPWSSVKLKNKPKKLLCSYNEIVTNIQQLKELGQLPDFVISNDIGYGDGGGKDSIVSLINENRAVWHKSCRNAIDNQKVERAKKRQQDQEAIQEAASPVKTRRMSTGSASSTQTSPSTLLDEKPKKTCFFCGEIGHQK